MLKRVQKHLQSQENAWAGMVEMIRTQNNFQIELFFAFSVIVVGFLFSISLMEWFMLGLSIVLVLTSEIFNTSIEYACDAITTEKNPLIKLSKDMGAAAVLLTALFAVFVGLIVFLPKILGML